MIRIVLLAAAVILACEVTLAAGEDGAADCETLLYWGPEHPAFLRLNLTPHGESNRAAWNEAVGSLFDAFDRNGDGTLTGDENLPGLLAMVSLELISDGASTGRTVRPPLLLARDAFPALLKDLGIHRCCIAPSPTAPPAPRVPMNQAGDVQSVDDDLLFAVLDEDRSADLSPRELLYSRCRKLDLNDDECLSARELLTARMFAADDLSSLQTAARRLPSNIAAPAARLTILASQRSLRNLARELLLRYDDNRDGVLSSEELGVPPGDATRLDHDGSGGLDLEEIEQMLRRPVVALELASPWPGDGSSQPRNISLGKQAVVVEHSASVLSFDRGAIQELFTQLDSDRNRYLEFAEVESSPPLKRAFGTIDGDSDRKLMPEEMFEYARRVALLAPRQLVASFHNQSRNLFETIDANRDAKLSAVELKAFADQLSQWDADRNGAVKAAEVISAARLTIGPASSWTAPQRGASIPTKALRQPNWFTRMDRNQDGVVSHIEFLASPASFLSLDTNRDHLLDAAEAGVDLRDDDSADADR